LALRSGHALAARQANHGETQPAEIHLKTADPCPGKPGQLTTRPLDSLGRS
jgi:hypothetical protein